MKPQLPLVILFSVFLLNCHQKNKVEPLFELLGSEITNIGFSNNIVTNDTFNALNYDYIYNGGGVAVGDINNDGLPDLYFSGNMVSSRLYLNKGNFQFEDITDLAGVGTKDWATGVAMVDINGDDFLDIYVCIANRDTTKSKNLLFINNGDNTFTEKAQEYGLDDSGYSTHAAFFDYDKDGDLDVYLLTNAYESFVRNVTRPKKTNGEGLSTDKLYRNNGDGTFTNVSAEAGILTEGYGLGVAIADINQDGWPDIYVANDFITNDLLWINNGDGTFTDCAARMLKHQSHNGMGTDVADFNNDGLLDIVVMDMLPEDNLRQKTMFPNISYDLFMMALKLQYTPQYVRNTLQLNSGNGTFSEIGQLAGIHQTDWSWSALFADFDNDGHKDLFVTNGYRKDVTDLDFVMYNRDISQFGTEKANKEELVNSFQKLKGAHVHNYMFRNEGDLTFKDQSTAWGFQDPTYSNGAAFVDLDNDGALDLVVNNIHQEASIYRNNANKLRKNNYLQIQLAGKRPNNAGLGTKILLNYQDQLQYHDHSLYRGYKSTVGDIIHFGLGDVNRIDKLTIIWPDGQSQVIYDVEPNQRIVLEYKNAVSDPKITIKQTEENQLLFTEVSGSRGLNYQHKITDNVDFKVQPLVPHKFSQNGPGIAVGDVTGNGLDDFYVGGAAGFPGMIYYQVSEGQFEGRDITGDKPEEDMGALLFDADNDGDLDLYVVSGGSHYPENSPNYKDRLYLNDGKGNFTLAPDVLPDIFSSGSCVVAADYDQDGDLDLFVGGRVVPAKYPMPAYSYILQNNGGTFEDVTLKFAPELSTIGLVTGALWTDFDNDNKVDLILVGEWMPITFFKNTGAGFANVTASSGLKNTEGWWNSIAAGDFDGDGDIDYIAGNLGLNSFYKASPEQPVTVYAKDFDGNGSMDPIRTHYIDGKEYPVHPRDNLIDQIPSMKGKFPFYNRYGKATIDEVLPISEPGDVYIRKSNDFRSSYIENKGNGNFEIRPLPIEAQFAPVYGILINDYDHDGNLDVLLSGNSYAAEINTGWYDASIGLYLKGDGKGGFSPVHVNESGFFVDKDAKGMAELTTGNDQSLVLVACNNDSLKAFRYASYQNKVIALKPDDAFAWFELKNGAKVKQEFYYGSTYLSQSSRVMNIPKDVSSITIYNFKGNSRSVIFPEVNVVSEKL